MKRKADTEVKHTHQHSHSTKRLVSPEPQSEVDESSSVLIIQT